MYILYINYFDDNVYEGLICRINSEQNYPKKYKSFLRIFVGLSCLNSAKSYDKIGVKIYI